MTTKKRKLRCGPGVTCLWSYVCPNHQKEADKVRRAKGISSYTPEELIAGIKSCAKTITNVTSSMRLTDNEVNRSRLLASGVRASKKSKRYEEELLRRIYA